MVPATWQKICQKMVCNGVSIPVSRFEGNGVTSAAVPQIHSRAVLHRWFSMGFLPFHQPCHKVISWLLHMANYFEYKITGRNIGACREHFSFGNRCNPQMS